MYYQNIIIKKSLLKNHYYGALQTIIKICLRIIIKKHY